MMNVRSFRALAAYGLATFFCLGSFGKGATITGDHSFSVGVGLTNSTQTDMDNLRAVHNSTYGGTSAGAMGSALEFYAQYQFRFTGTMFSMLFRPSYFRQNSTGTGCDGGDCEYNLNGFTFFPMFRMYPLENKFLGLFLQTGVGYGQLHGKIVDGDNSVEFNGGNFGAAFGLGVDFCFTDRHCMTIEGTARYLPISRNVTSSSSTGVLTGASQAGSGQELEIGNSDFGTTMSGIIGILGYTMTF